MNGDLNEYCMGDWYKCGGVARFIIWTQAFEKDGAHELARANFILHSCYELGLGELRAEKERRPGTFFPRPPWTGSIVGGHPLDEPFFPIGMTPWHT